LKSGQESGRDAGREAGPNQGNLALPKLFTTIKAFLFKFECAHIAIKRKKKQKEKKQRGLRRLRFYGHKILRSIVQIPIFNFTALKADGLEAQDSRLELLEQQTRQRFPICF